MRKPEYEFMKNVQRVSTDTPQDKRVLHEKHDPKHICKRLKSRQKFVQTKAIHESKAKTR